jgi:c-di-GMP phosphodiesterase
MSSDRSTAVPILPMLPVANRVQQLVALQVSPPNAANGVRLLQHLTASGFFEALPSVFVVLPISDLSSLPADLDASFTPQQLALLIPESKFADESATAKVAQWAGQGVRIFVGDTADLESPSEPMRQYGVAYRFSSKLGLPQVVQAAIDQAPAHLHWAKNINTEQQLQTAAEAGFSLFSGNYAFTSSHTHQPSDGGARARLLKLLGLVSRDADSHELEELFRQDAALSYMLLKLVSTAAFARPVSVTSFAQAIQLLGRRQLQRWLQLLLYASQQQGSGALNPLMLRAAFRASLLEVIAKKRGASKEELDSAFMVGMFSLLDVLFGSSLAEILQPLVLPSEVRAALLSKQGVLGAQLQLASVCDLANSVLTQSSLEEIGLDATTYYECMAQAYAWVVQVCSELP